MKQPFTKAIEYINLVPPEILNSIPEMRKYESNSKAHTIENLSRNNLKLAYNRSKMN